MSERKAKYGIADTFDKLRKIVADAGGFVDLPEGFGDDGFRKHHITIPGLPPAQYSGNARVHWTERRNARDSYYGLVLETIAQANGGVVPSFTPLDKCVVTVTFSLDHRRRDWDNLVSRTKPLWDALVNLHMIRDDSIDCITEFVLRYRYGTLQTEVLITEA